MSNSPKLSSTFDELNLHIERFSDLPKEAIIKQDALRLGISFDAKVFENAETYKPKDYFIFSFDLVPLSEMDESIAFKAPEEIRLKGGPYQLENTIISVRVNPKSPYRVELVDNRPALKCDGEFIGYVDFHGVPKFYGSDLESGHKISELVPVLEWGYLLYITAYRLCQYWGEKEECRFCDINENYRQQKKAGRSYTGIKSPEVILEALEHVDKKDTTAKAYTLTGGSITSSLQGYGEVEFYARYIEAIEKRFPRRWISKAVVQAFTIDECKRLADVGLQIYHPNYEVWDPKLFSIICPGKETTIGRETWIKRVIESAKVFGPSYVIPNFVGGVEMSQPHGFKNVDEAIASTKEGLDMFMSHGIAPRFTTWCPEPLSSLGDQPAPSLEYFCKLLLCWRECFERYQLPTPPGYGEPGKGKAVFSVSAFMDVIRS